jgi:hypothetical protein
MKNPEDNKFQIFVPYHTKVSILQDTHDNILSLFVVVLLLLLLFIV